MADEAALHEQFDPLADYLAEHRRDQMARIESGEITLGELQKMHFWQMMKARCDLMVRPITER